jgi:GDP-4-dehydro-6-deoxy-D-mannose reductase
MKRYLVTGVAGFLGSHLAEFLLTQDTAVYGTVHRDTKNIQHLKARLAVVPCDVLERRRIRAIVADVHPDVVVHLAGQTLPALSWRDAKTTFRLNILGALYLLDAIRETNGDPVVEVASSSAVYGFSCQDGRPIKEDDELRPPNPYGVSKVAVDLLSRLYWQAYGMRVVRVRPFSIVGPRKVGDVCSDLARGVVAVEKGQTDRIRVGNLAAVRDFVDVKDAVRAMWMAAEKDEPGEAYNICSGVGHKVQEILQILLRIATRPIPVDQDPARMRPSDVPAIIGDNAKLRALGWEPQIPIEETMAATLNFWRGLAKPESVE